MRVLVNPMFSFILFFFVAMFEMGGGCLGFDVCGVDFDGLVENVENCGQASAIWVWVSMIWRLIDFDLTLLIEKIRR